MLLAIATPTFFRAARGDERHSVRFWQQVSSVIPELQRWGGYEDEAPDRA